MAWKHTASTKPDSSKTAFEAHCVVVAFDPCAALKVLVQPAASFHHCLVGLCDLLLGVGGQWEASLLDAHKQFRSQYLKLPWASVSEPLM